MGKKWEVAWQRYLATEKRGIKKEVKESLDDFIELLLREPDWQGWAKDLARSVYDEKTFSLPLRFPLTQKVLLPALSLGVQKGEPNCARWLAQSANSWGKMDISEEMLPIDLQNEFGLLRMALHHDSSDHKARRLLAERLLNFLKDCVHELPAGVLWGRGNGVHIDDVPALLSKLLECEQLFMELGEALTHREFFEHCRFHFVSYGEYLKTRKDGDSYSEWCLREKGKPVENFFLTETRC